MTALVLCITGGAIIGGAVGFSAWKAAVYVPTTAPKIPVVSNAPAPVTPKPDGDHPAQDTFKTTDSISARVIHPPAIATKVTRAPAASKRAYVSLNQMNLDAALSAYREVRVRATFVVSGDVPAFAAKMKGCYAYSDKLYWDCSSASPLDIGDLAIGEFPYTFVNKPPTQNALEDIKTGTKKMYVYGYIEYRDAGNNPHVQEFCGTYSPTEYAGFFKCKEGHNIEARPQ